MTRLLILFAACSLLLVSGLAVILPWTLRNALVMRDFVPIETTAYENIWYANHFSDAERFQRQMQIIYDQPTPAAQRATALYFAVRGISRSPGAFVDKVRSNFWHFFRPEGLHNLFTVERPLEPWRHAFYVLLEDGIRMAGTSPAIVRAVVRGRERAGRIARRGAQHPGAIRLTGIAGARSRADSVERDAAFGRKREQFTQRRFEVLANVVGERFERRDVHDERLVGKLARFGAPDQPVEAERERRQRLSGARRRGDKHVTAGTNQRPALDLRPGRLAIPLGEPIGDERMKSVHHVSP